MKGASDVPVSFLNKMVFVQKMSGASPLLFNRRLSNYAR